jgi:hypothetical protein
MTATHTATHPDHDAMFVFIANDEGVITDIGVRGITEAEIVTRTPNGFTLTALGKEFLSHSDYKVDGAGRVRFDVDKVAARGPMK